MATEQGCGPLTDQERAIFDIVAGGPAAAFEGQDEVRLTSGAGSLRLRRQSDEDPEGPASEPMLLAGTAWEVSRIDGRPVGELNRRERARLTFEADRWTLDAGCAPLSGPWRQAGRTVTMKAVSSQPSSCSPLLKAEDSAIREMFAAAPQFVVGANREFVMAGGNHWMSAMFDRRLPSGAELLRGEWRIEAVDGAVPAAMPRPPSLIFGDSSYAIWDGCNHSEGIMLAVARQLFTRGSGVTTLASCVPDPLRSRIGAVLGNNPRIAKTDDRGLALVASTGTLRLTRLSERTFGRGEQLGLRAPRAIELLAPKGRLMLQSGNRFAISLDCGRIEGEWRGGQPARFSSGPLERTAPNCDTRPGSNAFRLGQFFTGNVLAITGPNRDIVLVVNEDRSIAGRVAE
jgi:heat shock protein HslJ